MRITLPFLGLVALMACDPRATDPERVAEQCEQRARAAQGPTGGVAIGANNRSGLRTAVNIGVSADYLAGRDPLEVYETCVFDRTGAAPTRPPQLR